MMRRAKPQRHVCASEPKAWVGDLVPKGDDFNLDLVERGVDQLRQDLETAMKEQLAERMPAD